MAQEFCMAQARLLEIIEMLRSSDQVVRKQAAIRLKALAENGLTAAECRLHSRQPRKIGDTSKK